MIKKYIKKPVVIEAVHYDGTFAVRQAIAHWMYGDAYLTKLDNNTREGQPIRIETLEGIMTATPFDFIIKEPFPNGQRHFYPCKPDIFEKTYELA